MQLKMLFHPLFCHLGQHLTHFIAVTMTNAQRKILNCFLHCLLTVLSFYFLKRYLHTTKVLGIKQVPICRKKHPAVAKHIALLCVCCHALCSVLTADFLLVGLHLKEQCKHRTSAL